MHPLRSGPRHAQPTHRVVEWIGVTGARELAGAGVRATRPQSFWLRRESRVFHGVTVERISGRALESVRPVAGERDELECVFPVEGQLEVTAGGTTTLGHGMVAFLPRWVEHRVRTLGRTTVLRVAVARPLLDRVVPRLPREPILVALRPGLLSATRAFAEEVLAAGGDSPVEVQAVGQLLVEMVGGAMLDHFGLGHSTGGTSAQLRQQALAIIAQRRSDPALGVDEIAAGMFVSPRRLQAAFAEVSTTVSAELRRQRTALAMELLTAPRHAGMSIDDIARRAGFGSTLTMRRAVVEAHGVTPSQARREQFS